jgi:diaminopimelate epimerase
MSISFYKYQGTGNDFILIDQRTNQPIKRTDTALINHLCNRRFGIGGDGLILLQHGANDLPEMIYFNADGTEGSMCGNGGRCFATFLLHLGILTEEKTTFIASDGLHTAHVKAITPKSAQVELHMIDVPSVEMLKRDTYFAFTGSPHFVEFTKTPVQEIDVVKKGRSIRYSPTYQSEGVNVNFVNAGPDALTVRTYERGVEDETLSCGTGATGAALCAHHRAKHEAPGSFQTNILVNGGSLEVRFDYTFQKGYFNIWLCGPAVQVFQGEIEFPNH